MSVTQGDRVLQLAHQRGQTGFTRYDAVFSISCFELSSRIGELEAKGWTFNRKRESSKNQFGDKVRYTRYSLDPEQQLEASAYLRKIGVKQ